MSLFGSLSTSASALQAQSQSTAAISTNIANVGTVGYKRTDTVFSDLVSSDGRFAAFTPAAVKASAHQRVGVQGAIQQTGTSTDAAIVGNGFFAVKNSLSDAEQFSYTRNGNFSPAVVTDAIGEQAYLRNSAGYFLYGWALDQDGGIIGSQTTLDGLQPVQISPDLTLARATTQATMSLNLDAREAFYDPHAATTPQELPVTNLASNFTRALEVFDSNGNSYDVDFQFRRIVGPMAHFSSFTDSPLELDDTFIDPNGDGPLGGLADGDQFSIALSTGATETYTFVDEATGNDIANNQIADVNGLIMAINAHGDGTQLTATISQTGKLVVRSNDLTGTLTLNEVTGTPLSGLNTLNIVQDPGDNDYVYEPEADITANGTANPNQSTFPALANTTDPNPFGWWEVSLFIDDPDPLAADDAPPVEVSKALINFNADGTLNAAANADGNIEIDLTTTPIDFDLGSDDGLVAFNVDLSGMRQFSSSYNVFNAEQNGADLGLLTDVQIDSDGLVQAVFSNGLQADLYRLPIITFNSPEDLQAVDGTAFTQTGTSGIPTLNFAGQGSAGTLDTASVEQSNVELATEFSKLIVTQRSYSASSRVISTIDEMTSDLARLKL